MLYALGKDRTTHDMWVMMTMEQLEHSRYMLRRITINAIYLPASKICKQQTNYLR